jgi:hypothetical protein
VAAAGEHVRACKPVRAKPSLPTATSKQQRAGYVPSNCTVFFHVKRSLPA